MRVPMGLHGDGVHSSQRGHGHERGKGTGVVLGATLDPDANKKWAGPGSGFDVRATYGPCRVIRSGRCK